jgi:hypothetical protein
MFFTPDLVLLNYKIEEDKVAWECDPHGRLGVFENRVFFMYIYLLTAIGLSHTNNTENKTNNNQTTQIITSEQHKHKPMW